MTTLLGSLHTPSWICGMHERSKWSQALRMTILWEFDEKHPKPVSGYENAAWIKFRCPGGTQFYNPAILLHTPWPTSPEA